MQLVASDYHPHERLIGRMQAGALERRAYLRPQWGLGPSIEYYLVPSLLLWSWDGLELAATSNVDAVEAAQSLYRQ